jgi:hypothetical protein
MEDKLRTVQIRKVPWHNIVWTARRNHPNIPGNLSSRQATQIRPTNFWLVWMYLLARQEDWANPEDLSHIAVEEVYYEKHLWGELEDYESIYSAASKHRMINCGSYR